MALGVRETRAAFAIAANEPLIAFVDRRAGRAELTGHVGRLIAFDAAILDADPVLAVFALGLAVVRGHAVLTDLVDAVLPFFDFAVLVTSALRVFVRAAGNAQQCERAEHPDGERGAGFYDGREAE